MVMPDIVFTKYESLENDFCVVLDGPRGFRWTRRRVAAICHRRCGAGSDGLVVLTTQPGRPVRFRLYNADGSTAEWSGNGIRCAAASLLDRRQRTRAEFSTAAGSIITTAKAGTGARVCVSFTRPRPAAGRLAVRHRLRIPHVRGPFPVDAGNPHWIFLVPDFKLPWETIGADCQAVHRMTHGVNVEFVRVRNRGRIELRVFERGVGPTPSSGSGALAAVGACLSEGLIGQSVRADSPGGRQILTYLPDSDEIRMTANARQVFRGRWQCT